MANLKPAFTDCPCGEHHELAPGILAVYDQVTAGLDPSIKVQVAGIGSWSVPRVYLACHGVIGGELPELAERYGWPKV